MWRNIKEIFLLSPMRWRRRVSYNRKYSSSSRRNSNFELCYKYHSAKCKFYQWLLRIPRTFDEPVNNVRTYVILSYTRYLQLAEPRDAALQIRLKFAVSLKRQRTKIHLSSNDFEDFFLCILLISFVGIIYLKCNVLSLSRGWACVERWSILFPYVFRESSTFHLFSLYFNHL